MSSNVQRGNYYRRKAMDLYKKEGYQVVLTEFAYPVAFGKTVKFYRKFDLLGADFIAWNDTEFILVQVKSVLKKEDVRNARYNAKKDFAAKGLPPHITKHLSIWLPRQKPITEIL
jgi:hypothetical protein